MCTNRCFVCGEPLTEINKSKEHILLNSAGGKLKSYEIMCSVCNGKLGSEPDNELAQQLRPVANHLGVKRDNGKNPSIPAVGSNGQKYDILDGGKPTLGEPIVEFDSASGKMHIEAADVSQARTALWKFKKEHPEYSIDVEKILSGFQRKTAYLEDSLSYNVNWGGELAFRSLVKTALDYYAYKKHDRKHIIHLLNYLLGKEEMSIVKMYYPDESPFEFVKDEVLNIIHIVGDDKSKTLFAYVTYLSCFSCVILLSDHYQGESFIETYAHDVMSHKEVDKIICLEMTLDKFNNYEPYTNNFYVNAQKAYDHTIDAGVCKQRSDELNNVIKTALADVDEGGIIEQSAIQKLQDGITKYAKHLLHIKE